MRYVSKQQQVINLLEDVKNTITASNVDIAIPILKWTQEKIVLDTNEKNRQNRLKTTKNRSFVPRAVIQGEIYGCNLGKNIGSEQNGHSRPVIIIQDTRKCIKSPTVMVIPLTDATDKDGNPKRKLNTQIELVHKDLSKKSFIKVEHARCISKARLTEKMGDLEVETLKDIKEMFKTIYKL